MKIQTRMNLITAGALAAIGLIACVIWWAYKEVESANRQRQQASEIARELSKLRLITFEYRLFRSERTRMQWRAISDSVGRSIARTGVSTPEQSRLLAGIGERRERIRGMFAELTANDTAAETDAPLDDTTRRFETQLLSRLLAEQQENFSDVFRLVDIDSKRIATAQRRMTVAILAGLLLVALIKIAAFWIVTRELIRPILRLQQATRDVAAGNLFSTLGIQRDDEIGELSSNFDAMTQSLRDSFEKIQNGNRELAMLNSELEAFSYSVSHDLRAPLRSLDGFSQALLEDCGDTLGEEGKDHLNRIRAASQRMARLIDDLLGLSKIARFQLRPGRVDLTVLAREIAASPRGDAGGRSVEWRIDEGMELRADPNLMRIALQNLLDNAWKYTGNKAEARIHVGARSRDGRQEFFVADNGAGFDMAYADRLFEPFQRLHTASQFPGTGVGLAIVRRIIRRHGGEIRAEAREGGGATFYFTAAILEEDSNEQVHSAG